MLRNILEIDGNFYQVSCYSATGSKFNRHTGRLQQLMHTADTSASKTICTHVDVNVNSRDASIAADQHCFRLTLHCTSNTQVHSKLCRNPTFRGAFHTFFSENL